MGVLDGKVAVITGGTSGIGARTARLFVAEGAQVVFAGRRREEGMELARRLGPAASFVATDVSLETDVKAMLDHALDRFGRVDCLINNAGNPGKLSRMADLDIGHFDSVMAVHVRGTVLGMKYAAPIMARQSSGSIINTASAAGHRAGFSALSYSTAKAAVIHATRCAAVELGESGIRVNSISPGPILTGIFGKAAGLNDSSADRSAGRMKPAFDAILPMWQAIPRMGMPEDIAHAALFLASDASSFITGHDLVVDGGLTAGRPQSVLLQERAAFAKAMQALAPNSEESD